MEEQEKVDIDDDDDDDDDADDDEDDDDDDENEERYDPLEVRNKWLNEVIWERRDEKEREVRLRT